VGGGAFRPSGFPAFQRAKRKWAGELSGLQHSRLPAFPPSRLPAGPPRLPRRPVPL